MFKSQEASGAGAWRTYAIQETFGEAKAFERNDLFLAEMRHLIQVAQGIAAPVCSLEDGIQALRIALAAGQSSRQGILVKPESLE